MSFSRYFQTVFQNGYIKVIPMSSVGSSNCFTSSIFDIIACLFKRSYLGSMQSQPIGILICMLLVNKKIISFIYLLGKVFFFFFNCISLGHVCFQPQQSLSFQPILIHSHHSYYCSYYCYKQGNSQLSQSFLPSLSLWNFTLKIVYIIDYYLQY